MSFFKRKTKVTLESEDYKTLSILRDLPINITIRRVKAKASGNNWSVQYLRGTVYYGRTLFEALSKITTRNEKVIAKIERNKQQANEGFIEDDSNE